MTRASPIWLARMLRVRVGTVIRMMYPFCQAELFGGAETPQMMQEVFDQFLNVARQFYQQYPLDIRLASFL